VGRLLRGGHDLGDHVARLAQDHEVADEDPFALDLLGDLLLLAVIATVAWQLTLYTRDVWRYGDVTMLMGWPKWPMWVMASAIWNFAVLVQTVMTARQTARLLAPRELPPVNHVETL